MVLKGKTIPVIRATKVRGQKHLFVIEVAAGPEIFKGI